MFAMSATESKEPSKRTDEPVTSIRESYVRSTDGATMIAIAPGVYVNEAVWKKLGAFR